MGGWSVGWVRGEGILFHRGKDNKKITFQSVYQSARDGRERREGEEGEKESEEEIQRRIK